MNKVTIIYGSEKDCIKNLTAHIIDEIHNQVLVVNSKNINFKYFSFFHSGLRPDRTLMVFVDVQLSGLPALLTQAYQDTIHVYNNGEKPFVMKRPELIIILYSPNPDLNRITGYNPHFEYVRINNVADYITALSKLFTVDQLADMAIDAAKNALTKLKSA